MDYKGIIMLAGMVLFFLGILFLGLAGMCFRFRALTNKPAWGGKTLGFLKLGLLLFIPGLILFALGYANILGKGLV